MKRIHVMAAVIRDAAGHILLARRPDHAHQGGLWEFPGGKREPQESRFAALQRELQEELGIQVTRARPLIDIRHDYPDKSIRLDVWQVDGFTGEPHGAEGQPVRWVSVSELDQYEFPRANEPIIKAVRLSDTYLITPDGHSPTEIAKGVERALSKGLRLIQLRQPHLDQAQYADLAERLASVCQGRADLLLKGEEQLRLANAGWHLTAAQLLQMDSSDWSIADYRQAGGTGLLAASCHNAAELKAAARMGVDFVTLSPVLPTRSHPGAPLLGWDGARELLAEFNLPAFLLGGLTSGNLDRAWDCGAQGIAGISGLWPGTI